MAVLGGRGCGDRQKTHGTFRLRLKTGGKRDKQQAENQAMGLVSLDGNGERAKDLRTRVCYKRT